MHFRNARASFTPTYLDTVPLNREPASAERTHIENKIAAKRQQIAQLAQEIRWLTMELES